MKRLFLDMDNVITDYSEAACSWLNKEFRNRKYDERTELFRTRVPDQLEQYEVLKNYKLYDLLEIKRLNQAMWDTPGFWDSMLPISGMGNELPKLREKYEIYIATRPIWNLVCVPEKLSWIQTHLPFLYPDRIIFTGNKGILSGDILVDDNFQHLLEFQGKRIIFTQPYNLAYTQFGFRVDSWKELVQLLLDGV